MERKKCDVIERISLSAETEGLFKLKNLNQKKETEHKFTGAATSTVVLLGAIPPKASVYERRHTVDPKVTYQPYNNATSEKIIRLSTVKETASFKRFKVASQKHVQDKAQTVQLLTFALDIFVMKLLEVQKAGFTEHSYEQLQNTILKAIVAKPTEVSDVFDELVMVVVSLQQKMPEQEYLNQNVVEVLRKALQAVSFSLKQISINKMPKTSVEQIIQTLYTTDNLLNHATTTQQLIVASNELTSLLMDVQIVTN